jgi:hypothetical protein
MQQVVLQMSIAARALKAVSLVGLLLVQTFFIKPI